MHRTDDRQLSLKNATNLCGGLRHFGGLRKVPLLSNLHSSFNRFDAQVPLGAFDRPPRVPSSGCVSLAYNGPISQQVEKELPGVLSLPYGLLFFILDRGKDLPGSRQRE